MLAADKGAAEQLERIKEVAKPSPLSGEGALQAAAKQLPDGAGGGLEDTFKAPSAPDSDGLLPALSGPAVQAQ